MPYLENIPFDELNIGDKASTERTLIEKDLVLFAAVSGDVNPIHLDADYASKTSFKQRIAHGAWSASLISGISGRLTRTFSVGAKTSAVPRVTVLPS